MTQEHIALPDIDLSSSTGELNLAQIAHDWLVIYFYPKDSTPGCTTQANDFTRFIDDFSTLNAKVIGVSRDSLKSHERFIEKQAINFTLISDSEEQLCQHFDVIKMKSMYGKQVRGIERSTFIYHQGNMVASYRKVKSSDHAEFILQEIKRLSQQS